MGKAHQNEELHDIHNNSAGSVGQFCGAIWCRQTAICILVLVTSTIPHSPSDSKPSSSAFSQTLISFLVVWTVVGAIHQCDQTFLTATPMLERLTHVSVFLFDATRAAFTLTKDRFKSHFCVQDRLLFLVQLPLLARGLPEALRARCHHSTSVLLRGSHLLFRVKELSLSLCSWCASVK